MGLDSELHLVLHHHLHHSLPLTLQSKPKMMIRILILTLYLILGGMRIICHMYLLQQIQLQSIMLLLLLLLQLQLTLLPRHLRFHHLLCLPFLTIPHQSDALLAIRNLHLSTMSKYHHSILPVIHYHLVMMKTLTMPFLLKVLEDLQESLDLLQIGGKSDHLPLLLVSKRVMGRSTMHLVTLMRMASRTSILLVQQLALNLILGHTN
jgi:hypothetical protein